MNTDNNNEQANLLRQLAKNAKQRLKNRSGLMARGVIDKQGTKDYMYMGRNDNNSLIRGQIVIKTIDKHSVTEEAFYKKVTTMLDNFNEEVINPLGYLADKKYMETLNSLEKQRYIFKLSEKYNKVKEAYMNEQVAFSAC